jgi:hypothetical protein
MSDSRLYKVSSLGLKQSPGDFDPPAHSLPRGSLPRRRVCLIPCSFPSILSSSINAVRLVLVGSDRSSERAGRVGGKQQSPSWIAKSPNQFGKKLVPAMTSLLASRPPNDLVFRHTHKFIQPSTQTVPVRSPLRPAPRSNRDKERARTKLLDAAKNRDEYDPTLIALPREDRDSSEDDDTSLLTPGLSVSYSSTSWSSASEPAEFSLARPLSRPLFSR